MAALGGEGSASVVRGVRCAARRRWRYGSPCAGDPRVPQPPGDPKRGRSNAQSADLDRLGAAHCGKPRVLLRASPCRSVATGEASRQRDGHGHSDRLRAAASRGTRLCLSAAAPRAAPASTRRGAPTARRAPQARPERRLHTRRPRSGEPRSSAASATSPDRAFVSHSPAGPCRGQCGSKTAVGSAIRRRLGRGCRRSDRFLCGGPPSARQRGRPRPASSTVHAAEHAGVPCSGRSARRPFGSSRVVEGIGSGNPAGRRLRRSASRLGALCPACAVPRATSPARATPHRCLRRLGHSYVSIQR